jgi:hypothetical protein
LEGPLPQTISGDPETIAALTGMEPLYSTPPLLAPEYPGSYRSQPLGQPVRTDQPVALLPDRPAWVERIEVSTLGQDAAGPVGPQPDGQAPWWEPAPEGAELPVAFRVLSGVRYSGGGHTVVISVAEPSPGALAEGPILGFEQVRLADGTTAWRNEDGSQPTPQIVSMMKDDTVVSVAGNLPRAEVEALAGQVVLQPASLRSPPPVDPR